MEWVLNKPNKKMLPSIFDEDESPATSDALLRASFRPRVGLAPPVGQHTVPSTLDPSLLDYDSFVSTSDIPTTSTNGPTETRQPARYIGGLVAKADERKKASEVVFERKLAREREAEDALYGEKEKFVTSAYATTLDERRLLIERDEKEESTGGAGGKGLVGKGGSNNPVSAASFPPPLSQSSFNGLGSGSSSSGSGSGSGGGFTSKNTLGTQRITNPESAVGSLPLEEVLGSANAVDLTGESAAESASFSANTNLLPSLEGTAFRGSTLKEVEEARRKATRRFQNYIL